jgi:ABC-type phosphate transport system permease subunit
MTDKMFNKISQFAIPILTISSVLLISLKFPGWGLVANICAQPFWLYSTWKAYKKAGQVGMFVNTVIITAIASFGVINYFFL